MVSLLWLDAGASFVTTWSGASFMGETLPDACVEHGLCPAECTRVVASTAGTYTFRALGATAASGCFQEPCACAPTDGSCFVQGDGMLEAPTLMVEEAIEYPATTSVELVFE
jgi:hypothetical protein